jgi:hypothetical protein
MLPLQECSCSQLQERSHLAALSSKDKNKGQQQQQQVLGDFQARNDTGTIAAGGGGQSQL